MKSFLKVTVSSLLFTEFQIQMDRNSSKIRNQDLNPCIQESDASQKCLDTYNYDKSMCSAYFQSYKDCRKYWHNIMVQRRREGVKPDMPTAAERQDFLSAHGRKPY
ncbi:coiled-coil-helix-coiled-coil-helix domain-containing protein 7 isoform X2 [Nerophis ophidion]|uniref:coiled-coil-helix-coiled-coil-helix domain-containing protein 7 isoform X2 n=1 Tax=Nerophis ophidion TaxID=159077 RepID=UPI002AE0395B|nr:coiled-coil-helix-coiled-coil-helix domain-containing protein 7 isoform X2 [Nerophis ophidion]